MRVSFGSPAFSSPFHCIPLCNTTVCSHVQAKAAQLNWTKSYNQMSEVWTAQQEQGGEEYDTGASLSPIESRLLSLAQQREVSG